MYINCIFYKLLIYPIHLVDIPKVSVVNVSRVKIIPTIAEVYIQIKLFPCNNILAV